MRVNNFTVQVREGIEWESGHVKLGHGAVYSLRLGNDDPRRRCDAEVLVDGKHAGTFRLDAGQNMTLERPAHDSGRFTFFAADSSAAGQAGVADVARDQRGLIQVTFRPERRRPPVLRDGPLSLCSAGTPRAFGYNEPTAKGLEAGVTGLTGQSAQQFHDVAALDYDPAGTVTISLRLVCSSEAAVRPLTAVPRSNPVPAPVE